MARCGDRNSIGSRCGALCACVLHKFLGASTHLVGRNILDVRCDGPCVSERILQRARSIPVELILDGLQFFCSACDRSIENFVHPIDVYHQAHTGSAKRLWTAVTHFRMFVCEHDHRIANPDLRVADSAIRTRHAHQFGGAECAFVEIDSVSSAFDNEIGSDRMIAVRN
jgi:hypothetical protein